MEFKVAMSAGLLSGLIPMGPGHEWLDYLLRLVIAFGPTVLVMVVGWRRRALAAREKLAAKMLADGDPANDEKALNILVHDAEEKVVLDVVEDLAAKKKL